MKFIIKYPGFIKNYWLKEKKVVFLILFFGILFNSLTVIIPVMQGKLIDSLLNKESTKQIIIKICMFIGIVIFVQLARFFKRFYVRRFANITSGTMRLMIYNNIMNKNINELDNENIGDLMTRVISDVEICVEGMRKITTEVFDTGVLMLAYITSMLMYDINITLLSCLFIPIAIIIAELLKGIIYKYSIAYRNKSSEVTNTIYNNIENTILFRINGLEKRNRDNYFFKLYDLQNKAIKANILENAMQPIYNTIALLGIVSVIYIGGQKVINQTWSIGNFSSYIIMFTAITTKASKVAKLFNTAQKSKISWLRIKPYLNEYIKKDTKLNIKTEETNITIKDLSFSYEKINEKVIDKINFKAKQGDIIGVTGPIASGKSTLGIALTGLYNYYGSIKIDDKELKYYNDYEKSNIISYLGHNPQLLSDTIYNNITLGNNKNIDEVLKDVCFDTDLNAMKEKENTLVGNSGIRLSGGQQARLSLARTLLNKNKIIILDDPFSAIDMNTEAKIIRNLRKYYKNSIIIIISHRLTIFKDVNYIIMINNDKTLKYGTHYELMNSSKLYSTIYTLQSGEKN